MVAMIDTGDARGGGLGLVAEVAELAGTTPDAQLLERIALALTSTLELEDVLRQLAYVGLDATGAGGTAILLLEGRTLRPAAVARVLEQNNLQERFHRMGPLQLDPLQWELLVAGRALALEDARQHDLVPAEWVDAFTLRGLALVPLMAGGEPCGLMAVDWDAVRSFGPADIALLESIGAYAGIAVHVAQLFSTMRRRARLQQALAQSAANLASPLSPETIATRLVDSYADLLGARLSAVALFDEERAEMRTVASRGTRAMNGALPVTDVPADLVTQLVEAWKETKRPVELDDHPWLADVVGGRDVGATSYLVLPLAVDGQVRGAVLLGFGEGTRLDAEERSAAEALADIAAAALGRHELLARLDTQVQRLAALQAVSAALNSSASLPDVLDVVCSSFESILGTNHCSVNLVAGDASRTLAQRGVAWSPAPVEIDPSTAPEDVRSAALFPLNNGDDVIGFIVAGFPTSGSPSKAALEVGQALTDLAASAVDRAQLTEALHVRLRQVEALSRLSDVVAATADVNAAMAELDLLLRPELSARFESISLTDRQLRESVRARTPDREEAAAVRSWRAQLGRGSRLRPRSAADALVLVPVVHRNRVHGALRVSLGDGAGAAAAAAVTAADEDLLVAVGAGCGEIVHKAALQRELSERERRLAISSERERIARDLHDSVGQVMTGMGMLLNHYVAHAPDDVWRGRLAELAELADRGSTEVRKSIYSLLFLDTRRHGLAPSLHELAAKFEATTGVRVTVTVPRRGGRGSVSLQLTSPREEALFRAAHEALMNVERHARAASVDVVLSAVEGHVVLTIADDGTGLPDRLDGPDRGHFGLGAIRQRLEEVGGTLRLASSVSGGAQLEARVPVRSGERG